MAKLFAFSAIFVLALLAPPDVTSAHPILDPAVVPARVSPIVRQDANPMTILETVLSLSADGGTTIDNDLNNYDMLAKLVALANLSDALNYPTATLTVFAPTDGAFLQTAQDIGIVSNVDVRTEEEVLAGMSALASTLFSNPDGLVQVLREVLLYHVAPVRLSSDEIFAATTIETLAAAPALNHDAANPFALIDEATGYPDPMLVASFLDLSASNGVIHVIDRVLLPVNVKAIVAALLAGPRLGNQLSMEPQPEESAEPSTEPIKGE
jgi:uncharacterized surface protein with fasciclin (FAS1) repeats